MRFKPISSSLLVLIVPFALTWVVDDAFAQPAPAPSAVPPSASFPRGAAPAPPSPSAPAPAAPPTSVPAPATPEPAPPPPLPPEPPPPLHEAAPRAPESKPATREPAPPVEPEEPPQEGRSFYLLSALLLAGHAHVSSYKMPETGKVDMSAVGGGYELVLMLGSRKKNFAFGGGVTFVHVPRSKLRIKDKGFPDYEADARSGIFALTIGPSVDYRPSRAFHIGGLIGVAVESIPKFEPEPTEKDTVAGGGAEIWLGFDWKASTHLRPGILLTGAYRVEANRDIDDSLDDDKNLEGSLSIGLGFSLAYY